MNNISSPLSTSGTRDYCSSSFSWWIVVFYVQFVIRCSRCAEALPLIPLNKFSNPYNEVGRKPDGTWDFLAVKQISLVQCWNKCHYFLFSDVPLHHSLPGCKKEGHFFMETAETGLNSDQSVEWAGALLLSTPSYRCIQSHCGRAEAAVAFHYSLITATYRQASRVVRERTIDKSWNADPMWLA